MRRHFIKLIIIAFQFAFYLAINKIFRVHDRIIYSTFLIYLALNLIKNMYSFKTILIWDELRRQLQVHFEFLVMMLINDFIFMNYLRMWEPRYMWVHVIVGVTFTFFNIMIIKTARKVFRHFLEKRLLIVGIGKTARKLTNIINQNDFTMYKLVGYVSVNSMKGINQKSLVDTNYILGSYETLDKLIERHKINEVIIAVPLATNEQMNKIINKVDEKISKLKFIPELNSEYSFNSEVENYDGLMLVSTKINFVRGISSIIKRIIDILISFFGIIALAPLTLYVWLRTDKEERKHGLFFSQERIGKHGKRIIIHKFRSMVTGADEILEDMLRNDPKISEEYKEHKKLKHDPRVTKIGRFLRRTSLDEFPQFINVFKGEMSFVGPRPYLFKEKDDMGKYYKKIIKNKPGMTGMWQSSGRSEKTFGERLVLDEYYYRNWSLWLDTVIIIKTAKIVMNRKGAY